MSFTLVNFTDLTLDEKKMVLSWRNYPNVKKWMHNQQDISLQEHLEYIEHLKDSQDKLYFVVKKDTQYFGVIDFTTINMQQSSAEFGLYTNPFQKMQGIGKILIETAIHYAFDILKIKTLRLEVMHNNLKALKLYQKYNFKEIYDKVVNNTQVICMELHNEDR